MARSSRPRTRQAAVLLAAVLLVGACTGGSGSDPTTTTTRATTTTAGGAQDRPDGGPDVIAAGFTGVRLSKGNAVGEPAVATPVVGGTPLEGAAIDAVLSRLPGWDPPGTAATAFNWPAQTLRPPQPGTTIQQPFPSTEPGPETPAPSSDPLRVLRYQPEGGVDIAPFVSITFDQPMVPVGTLGQLDAAAVPATIVPDIPGRWQWIGTDTLRFDASSDVIDRLPMATDYTITVPAGTTSVTGAVLADAVSWTFSTPTPRIQSFRPDDDDAMALVPLYLATFDQRVDATAVLATVHLTADGQEFPVRLATAAEIAADTSVQQVVDRVPEGRWIAFRPVDPLPADTPIRVEVGPDVPSAEGSKTSSDVDTYTGRTYAPLRVEDYECSSGDECPPEGGITVTFNNSIDPDRFDPATIVTDPAIPGAVVGVYDDTISISGALTPEQTYAITVPAAITDVFGQQLGADDTGTIRIGPARPSIRPLRTPITTIDPSADPPSITVVSSVHEQLRVRVYAVTPDDWPDQPDDPLYSTLYYGDPNQDAPDLPVLRDETIEVEGAGNTPVETAIDLGAVVPGGHGHVLVRVESVEEYGQDEPDFWANRPTTTWVQGTDIGLDAVADADEVRAWTTDLATGAPLEGVTVRMVGIGPEATTDADGVARLDRASTTPATMLATRGDDRALLPDLAQSADTGDVPLWYVLDDRQVYRPGETVSVKGWVRRLGAGDAQLGRWEGEHEARYKVRDPQGNVVAEGAAPLNPLGGFDLQFALPEGSNTGAAWIAFALDADPDTSPIASAGHQFQIAEFRRPEFEVAARAESEGPYVRGTPLTMAADAAYYAGGPLGNAPVEWHVTTASASYSPPGWDDFTFGRWTPWWWISSFDDGHRGPPRGFTDEEPCCFPGGETDVATYTGITDAAGSQYLDVAVGDLGEDDAALPVTVSAQATVVDVNRQPITATTDVLVHPAGLYAGLRSSRTFVRKGEPLEVEIVVTDIDGAAVAGRDVTVTASRTQSAFRNGAWTDEQTDQQSCAATSAIEPVPCSFTTSTGGTYRIEVSVTDDQGRTSRSELTRWVSSAESIPNRTVQEEELTIVPDAEEYAPGDTAELLVQAPFASGSGLLTVAHGGITSSTRFDLAEGSAVVQVPVAEADVPGLDVSIEVVGSAPRLADDGTPAVDAPNRPAFATGGLWVPVTTASRALTVSAIPRETQVAPGATTAVDVTVIDAGGRPVAGADLAVIVVDEAVLALSGYALGDPLDTFYGSLPSQIAARYGRESIVLVDPAGFRLTSGAGRDEQSAETTAAGGETTTLDSAAPSAPESQQSADDSAAAPRQAGGTPGSDSATAPAIDVRSNFDALAVWAPEVTTDATGAATVDVPLPDNLTRYRVMVVAAAGDQQFGTAEANITARLPLMVRPSAPRFLNVGDTFELPVVIQNQGDATIEADVIVEATNLEPAAATGVRVSVPANDRVEVRFPMSAALAGTGRLRVTAAAGEAADSATVELPVYTPATSEAFATYGVVDDGAIVQPVLEPTDVLPQYGGLDVSTSSTALQALTDAVIYLSEYPYRSSDAMASRILAIVALRDVLDAFDAPGLPSADELEVAVAADIDGLVALQNDDGGWPYWARGRVSEPYNSVQATHALVAARDAGYAVPESAYQQALFFVQDIESRIPSEYGDEARDTIGAYALNVRALAGQRDPQKAEALYTERKAELGLEALAWLWPVIDDQAALDEVARTIANRAVDTAGAVTFTTEVGDEQHVTLGSQRRTDGLLLDALITMQPDSDLIPKAVTGLLSAQDQGRWENVQENAFILLALKHYFDVYEAATPEFVARVWLGQQYAGEQVYSGRTTDRNLVTIPTAQLQEIGDADLTIAKEGIGRLYYRVGLRTAPSSLQLQPLDRGFVVVRAYEAVDDPADVTRDADGTWRIRAGAQVRVRLTMVAESQRTHVALVDPLPAGLEILNPTLATAADVPEDPAVDDSGGADTWFPWYPTWFDHQNQRDDRAEAFATYLAAGTYDYSYVTTATTPGTFVTPPTRAEEIYAPETFGRAATDRIVIS